MFLHFEKTSVRRFAAGALSVLLVLAFVFGVLPQAVSASNGTGAPLAAQAATCSQNHTVVAGDTLSSLSVKYDVSIAEIASANSLTEPYALSVGQELCIPGAAQTTSSTPVATSTTTAANSTSSGTDANMTLTVDGNLLTIVTANLATTSSYYVKIAPYYVRSTPKWTKVGFLRTKKEGAVSKTFKLPKGVRGAPSIQVCLKNATNDDMLCRRIAVVVSQ